MMRRDKEGTLRAPMTCVTLTELLLDAALSGRRALHLVDRLAALVREDDFVIALDGVG